MSDGGEGEDWASAASEDEWASAASGASQHTASEDDEFEDAGSEGGEGDGGGEEEEEGEDEEEEGGGIPMPNPVPPLHPDLHALITRITRHVPQPRDRPYPAPYGRRPTAMTARVREREVPSGMDRRNARPRDVLNHDVWEAAGIMARGLTPQQAWDRMHAHTVFETGEARPVDPGGVRALLTRRLHGFINHNVVVPPPRGQHMVDIFDAADHIGGTLMQSMSQRSEWTNADLWRAHKDILPTAIRAMWAALHADE